MSAKPKKRMPTSNLEQAIIGCILLNGELIQDAELQKLESGHFTHTACTIIYQIMLDMADNGVPIDAVLVINNMRKEPELDYILEDFIYELACNAPGVGLFEHYVHELINTRDEERGVVTVAYLKSVKKEND